MNIELKRDGITLRGELLRANEGKSPVAIIFHGLMSCIRHDENNIMCHIADLLLEKGISVVRFDFNGHGKSDGEFSDMNVYGEILDAAKIMDYVRNLPFAQDIYIVGHSQGGLVGGMIAGYYREYVKKLVLLAPAATIKDDALKASCFGTPYDGYNIPDYFPMTDIYGEKFNLGGLYFRIAKTIPVYETTSMFEGETLIIHGTKDDAVGVIGSQRYKECMDNVTLDIIEGETHGLNEFSMMESATKVAEFLAK